MIPRLLLCLALVASAEAYTAQQWRDQGIAAETALKTKEALRCFEEAAKLTPNDATLWVKIAKQHGESMCDARSEAEKKKAADAALVAAQKAESLDPKLPDAALSVAVCYGRLLELVPARTKVEYSRLVKEKAERAIALDKSSDLAWHMLGRWHQACSELGGFTRALVRVVYGGLPDASLEDAAACFTKAEKLAPRRLCHAAELGITLSKLGKTTEARQALTRALALPNRERDDPDTRSRAKATLDSL
jgi:tetratricopeptide (TPR) repeat protein